MKKYAYYPGCSLTTLASEYDVSFRNLCSLLKIDMEEIPGWICCGAIAACSASPLMGVTVPLKNVALALENGMSDIIAPCSACFYHLKSALHRIEADQETRQDAEDVLGASLDENVRVLHPLELLERHISPEIGKSVVRDLSHLKVACYYGCLLTRPSRVMKFDSPEYPRSMDRLLQKVGIPTIEWSYKTDCCGAFYASINPDVVVTLTKRILEDAIQCGANCLAVACPMCHINLDARQGEVEAKYGTKYSLPILYFTQLMGAALGIEESGLGLWRHMVDPQPLMRIHQ